MNIAEAIEKIKRLLDDQQWDAAIEACNALLREEPDNLKALVFLSVAYSSKGKYDKAITEYDKAVTEYDKVGSHRQRAAVRNGRGVCYFQKDDHDKAIADFDEAIKLDNKLVGAYSGRGLCYIMKDEYERAITDFSKVIELNSKQETAFIVRGWCYLKKGEYDKAIDDCDEAIKLNSESASAYSNRGNIYFKKGEYKQAISDYHAAINIYREQSNTNKLVINEVKFITRKLVSAEINADKSIKPCELLEKKCKAIEKSIEGIEQKRNEKLSALSILAGISYSSVMLLFLFMFISCGTDPDYMTPFFTGITLTLLPLAWEVYITSGKLKKLGDQQDVILDMISGRKTSDNKRERNDNLDIENFILKELPRFLPSIMRSVIVTNFL